MYKSRFKKILPLFVLDWYHRAFALFGSVFYGNPSSKMIVVGVTGTNGKTTVSFLIARLLESAGHRVGLISTAQFKIGEQEWLNDKKMTMLGRFQTHHMLAQMRDEGCTHVVVETSSEGIKQHRHRGINYDIAVFTNLTPEHIEAHGGFENYKKAKGELFKRLRKLRKKTIDGKKISKQSVINGDDAHASYFLGFDADQKTVFSFERNNENVKAGMAEVVAQNISTTANGSTFTVEDIEFKTVLPGEFNVENSLAAVATVNAAGVTLEQCAKGLEGVGGVPGRMEQIHEGQDFSVIVDYAPEVASVQKLYEVLDGISHNRLIHVLGSCGGGRDKDRQPKLGMMAGEYAQIVFVTNEDPYDDDPMEIIDAVAGGALQAGKKDGEDLFRILDRTQAIQQALGAAKPGDLVLITGKGCEQAMCVAGGKKIPWDDREVVRSALKTLL